MQRYFNVAGPCVPDKHYLLPTSERCAEIHSLIASEMFFVIHAARQCGKTTLLNALQQDLETGGRYHALYCSLESVQGIEDPERGIKAVFDAICLAIRRVPGLDPLLFSEGVDVSHFTTVLCDAFGRLCARLDKPLVVLFDEADCLSGQTLITFLRQLRDGYISRAEAPFIHSLALVGMRSIRDYKAEVRPGGTTLGSASPFNIVTKSLTLNNFTRDEIATLYAQHTADTGETFAPEAVDRAHYWTEGQPWLVNALAREIVMEMPERDRSAAVSPALIDEAAERLMRRRDTHLDSLLERLKEPRVRGVIEPVMTGGGDEIDRLGDDFEYVKDLGLVKVTLGTISPANPIYATVIARTLNFNTQENLPASLIDRWLTQGGMDMDALLREFQQFWRENSDIWIGRYEYREAAPHLILMAFLQRVLNGGALIEREMGSGRKRLDLGIRFRGRNYPIEIKLHYGPKTLPEGLAQLSEYMDTLGTRRGWLVIFDRRPEVAWDEKISWCEETLAGHEIAVVGC